MARLAQLSQELTNQDKHLLAQQRQDQEDLFHSCTQLSQMIESENQAVERKFERASQASDQVKRSLVSAHDNSLLQEDKSKSEIKRLG